jgi:hypothetical protein
MKKLLLLILFPFTSCGYHVSELRSELNPSGSTTTEIFQYAVVIGILIFILWLIGRRNQKNRNN